MQISILANLIEGISDCKENGDYKDILSISEILNTIKDSISVPSEKKTALEIQIAFDSTETLTNAQINALTLLYSASGNLSSFDLSDSETLNKFEEILGSSSKSFQNIKSLATRSGSLIEKTFGVNISVNNFEVGRAILFLKGEITDECQ